MLQGMRVVECVYFNIDYKLQGLLKCLKGKQLFKGIDNL